MPLQSIGVLSPPIFEFEYLNWMHRDASARWRLYSSRGRKMSSLIAGIPKSTHNVVWHEAWLIDAELLIEISPAFRYLSLKLNHITEFRMSKFDSGTSCVSLFCFRVGCDQQPICHKCLFNHLFSLDSFLAQICVF